MLPFNKTQVSMLHFSLFRCVGKSSFPSLFELKNVWKDRETKASLESLYEAQIPNGRFEKHSSFTHTNNNPNANWIQVFRFSFFVAVVGFLLTSHFHRALQWISDVCFYVGNILWKEENSLHRKTVPFIQHDFFFLFGVLFDTIWDMMMCFGI